MYYCNAFKLYSNLFLSDMAKAEKLILKIFIKGKWFDEIVAKRKKIEYREVGSFWISRLYDANNKKRLYDQIEFINGFKTDARRVTTGFEGFKKRGEEFQISIGRIIKKNY